MFRKARKGKNATGFWRENPHSKTLIDMLASIRRLYWESYSRRFQNASYENNQIFQLYHHHSVLTKKPGYSFQIDSSHMSKLLCEFLSGRGITINKSYSGKKVMIEIAESDVVAAELSEEDANSFLAELREFNERLQDNIDRLVVYAQQKVLEGAVCNQGKHLPFKVRVGLDEFTNERVNLYFTLPGSELSGIRKMIQGAGISNQQYMITYADDLRPKSNIHVSLELDHHNKDQISHFFASITDLYGEPKHKSFRL